MAQPLKRKPPARKDNDVPSERPASGVDAGDAHRERLRSLTEKTRTDLEELLVPHALYAARRGHHGSPVAFVDIPLLALDILAWAIAAQLRQAGAATGAPTERGPDVTNATARRNASSLLDQRVSELRAEFTRRGSLPKNPYELSGPDANIELVRLGFPPLAADRLMISLLPHLTDAIRRLAEGARRR